MECVNALLGFPSFLRSVKKYSIISIRLYQCPFGLLFISTMTCRLKKWQKKLCVNAHSGFSSFPHDHYYFIRRKTGCVNAHSGFSSFPPWRCITPIAIFSRSVQEQVLHRCQCPSGLSFISTGPFSFLYLYLLMCQCPSGLSFISTGDYLKNCNLIYCVNALLGFPSFPL